MPYPSLVERITRSLAYMLRHQPEQFDLELDEYGYADLDDVVAALNERLGEPVEADDVVQAVEAGDRPRYEIREGRIRALYGHSIQVKPGEPGKPPALLYVGISKADADRARRYGLRPGRRSFLHLALTPEDALETGRRASRDYVVITVNALEAWEEGINFYDRRSLFLSDPIPTHFLQVGDVQTDGYGEEGEDSGRGGRMRRAEPQEEEAVGETVEASPRPAASPAAEDRQRPLERSREVRPEHAAHGERPGERAGQRTGERSSERASERTGDRGGHRHGSRGRDRQPHGARREHAGDRRPAIQREPGAPERISREGQAPDRFSSAGRGPHRPPPDDRRHDRPPRDDRRPPGRGPDEHREPHAPVPQRERAPEPIPARARAEKEPSEASSSFGTGVFEQPARSRPAEPGIGQGRPRGRPDEESHGESHGELREQPRAKPRETAQPESEDSGFGAGI